MSAILTHKPRQVARRFRGQYLGATAPRRLLRPGEPIEHDPAVRGLLLKAMREAKDISQARLAKAIGVSRSLVALVETGKSGLSIEHLLAWIDVCDGDLGDLVPVKGAPLLQQIRQLPDDERELVELLVHVLGSVNDPRLWRILKKFLVSTAIEADVDVDDFLRSRSDSARSTD